MIFTTLLSLNSPSAKALHIASRDELWFCCCKWAKFASYLFLAWCCADDARNRRHREGHLKSPSACPDPSKTTWPPNSIVR